MAMQLLVHDLMPHYLEMLAMMHIFPGLDVQAGASASDDASAQRHASSDQQSDG